jgi:hypothetical protein
MTDITYTLRDQALVPVAGDIPQGMTLAQYRGQRRRRVRRRRLRLPQFSTK